MTPLATAVVLAAIAGLALPLGAVLARYEHIRREPLRADILHAIVAFGGAALISALALVLLPQGAHTLPDAVAIALFVAGGVVFYGVDKRLAQAGGSSALLLAMLLDFLPEAMALGALLVTRAATSRLLAAMIFLQNVPEGFAAFREIWKRGDALAWHLLLVLLALAGLGPLCAAFGLLVLTGAPAVLGAIMMFASGGILYLVFQDIAPESRREGSGSPALGAVAGFALGFAGNVLIG